MGVRLLSDPVEFAELARPYLAADPLSTNVIGVQLDGVLAGIRPAGSADLWIVVTEPSNVIGVGMHTPPHSVFLPRLRPGCASEIAVALQAATRDISGVNGERTTVVEFIESWSSLTNATATLLRSMRMYRLDQLRPPAGVDGKARRATESDQDLVSEWFVAFEAETAQEEDFDPGLAARRRLASGDLWFWVDQGQPVALAGRSRPAAGVARVGPVYTPPVSRGRGYGSAVTAAAAQCAMSDGAEQVVLYTDLSNPTSNAIYQQIGFVEDHDAQNWSLAVKST